jgi:hypothetical protein
MGNPSYDNQFPCRDLKYGTPKYKRGVPTIQLKLKLTDITANPTTCSYFNTKTGNVFHIFQSKGCPLWSKFKQLIHSCPTTGCGKLASFFLQTAQFKKGS